MIVIIVAGIFFSLQNTEPMQQDQVGSEQGERPAKEFKEAKLTLFNKDRSYRLELSSKKIVQTAAKNIFKLTPVYIEVFSTKTEQLAYTFTGSRAKYDAQARYLEVFGPVQVEQEFYNIYCNWLGWQLDNEIIRGREEVKIDGPRMVLTGDSFLTDPDFIELKVETNQAQKTRLVWEE